MKDLIFIDIVVEHMQKMHKEITCESKQIDIMSKIGNQFVLKAKTVNEIMVLSDMLKLLTGMTRTELTKEIRMREIQAIKEIDEYVESLKETKEPNDIFGKVLVFGTKGAIDVSTEFEKLWNTHTEQNHLTEEMNVDFKNKDFFQILSARKVGKSNIIRFLNETYQPESSEKEILNRIKEIIPVINDNFLLTQRLEKLKKIEQRLKKLPKSERGELSQIQKQINTIKSWL